MRKVVSLVTVLIVCLGISAGYAAVDNSKSVAISKLSKKKQTKLGLYVTAVEAHELAKTNKVLFIDVRSRAEVNFLGMPTIADANIPYMDLTEWYDWNDKKNSFKMDVNSHFQAHLEKRLKEKGLDRTSQIVLMCRSGSRSAKAANLLADLGYKNVYTVIDGYEGDKAKVGELKGQRVVNGWRNAKLPWTYKLDKKKMYFN